LRSFLHQNGGGFSRPKIRQDRLRASCWAIGDSTILTLFGSCRNRCSTLRVKRLDCYPRLRHLAARCARGFENFTLENRGRRECRALAAPAVPCAMGVVDARTSIQGQRKHSGIPHVAVLRLMPRSPRRRIRFCHRRWRIKADRTGWPDVASASLTSATDARPTRFCRTLKRRSFCAPAIPHGVQPAL
jgi:hypothetical protein